MKSILKVIFVFILGIVVGFAGIWAFDSFTGGGEGIDEALQESDAVRDKNVEIIGNGKDKITMLIYMNGSNLESDGGAASEDLREILAAGDSENVNILIQTMGTKQWHDFGIASNRSQIYKVEGHELVLVKDDLGQLDCTDPNSLSGFIKWGTQAYPANRYILQFWNHGGGPVLGFGYDEFNEDGYLSTDEIHSALKNAGVFFDWIGMDCCIMSTLEVGCIFYDYCDYTILSEDFESGLGWYYTDFLNAMNENTSIPTPELAQIIIDSMIEDNVNNDCEGILSCMDESMMKILFQAWKDFAYANEDALLDKNYSQQTTVEEGGKAHPYYKSGFDVFWDWFNGTPTLDEYYVTDLMAVAQNIESQESQALASALAQTIVYSKCTEGDNYMTGLAVTLPYGDEDYYNVLKQVFTNCGIDSDYIDWLYKFTEVENVAYFDFDQWIQEWDGWSDFVDDFNWEDWYGWEEFDTDYWLEQWGFSDYLQTPENGHYYDDEYYEDDNYYDDHEYYDSYGYYEDIFFNWLNGKY